MNNRLWLLLFVVFFTSCITRKQITYFQDIPGSDTAKIAANSGLRTALYEPTIKPGDILNITVMSLSAESNALINYPFINQNVSAPDKTLTQSTPGFLVDNEGNIQVPMLGNIKVDGLTTTQIRGILMTNLERYLQSPTVSVRFSNFKITILGDVARPGVYPVPNERITILEALGISGDLSVYGLRKGVKLIREVNGENQIYKIDLTSKEVLNSPYMYLQPNDVIYVDPGGGKAANADNVYKVLPIIISGISALTVLMLYFK
ncbi:MAG: polysaccharide biosynthesis/export family protein [Bacteroidia bacterium]